MLRDAGRCVELIHWQTAEGGKRVEQLEAAGYEVRFERFNGPSFVRRLRKDLPDAVVIDLTRLPSQGRDVGLAIRQAKATRHLPLLFVGGDAEKVERVRELLPDAVYSTWRRIRSSLKRAIARPLEHPVVPKSALAGYSGTPLAKKLGIESGSVVALLGAPSRFEETLGELPPDIRLKWRSAGVADRVLLFVRSQSDLRRRFTAAERCVADGGGLWIAWPKKASGVVSDLTQAVVRAHGLEAGLVDYKICSIDTTWSGLLFARRRLQ